MKERPILFSAPMVKALLEGRKTQTRRIMKPQPEGRPMPLAHWARGLADACGVSPSREEIHAKAERLRGRVFPFERKDSERLYSPPCPYGYPGDRLWVKETHAMLYQKSECPVIAYRADDSARIVFNPPEGNFTLAGQAGEAASTWRAEKISWRPSLFMPRWASRITLEITDVRVQRVEEISGEDAEAEGVTPVPVRPIGGGLVPDESYREGFLRLFYDINKRAKRGENPWVWALTFKVVKS